MTGWAFNLRTGSREFMHSNPNKIESNTCHTICVNNFHWKRLFSSCKCSTCCHHTLTIIYADCWNPNMLRASVLRFINFDFAINFHHIFGSSSALWYQLILLFYFHHYFLSSFLFFPSLRLLSIRWQRKFATHKFECLREAHFGQVSMH